MARAKHTNAVRLTVEGGNRVKADRVSVGASGEPSMRKIDRASDRASRGLGSLGDRASSRRTRMRLLGGVVAGIACPEASWRSWSTGRSPTPMVMLIVTASDGETKPSPAGA